MGNFPFFPGGCSTTVWAGGETGRAGEAPTGELLPGAQQASAIHFPFLPSSLPRGFSLGMFF